MHYWGSVIRQMDVAINYLPHTRQELNAIYPEADDERTRRRTARINRNVDLSIVGGYSLLPYSPESVVVNQAIDLEKFGYVGCKKDTKRPRIVHALTAKKLKGTEVVSQTLARLKQDGLEFESIIVANESNTEALGIYKTADIVVDSVG